jgi:hypothetical protein
MYIVYYIFPRMLGGFLHICTCTCTIYCDLWPPDNTSCTFITWYQSLGLGLIFSDAQLVRNSGRRPSTPGVAAFPLSRRPAVWSRGGLVRLVARGLARLVGRLLASPTHLLPGAFALVSHVGAGPPLPRFDPRPASSGPVRPTPATVGSPGRLLPGSPPGIGSDLVQDSPQSIARPPPPVTFTGRRRRRENVAAGRNWLPPALRRGLVTSLASIRPPSPAGLS